MKINFNQELKTLEGKAIPNDKREDTTLRDVATQALLISYQDESNLGGEQKAKRWLLAMKIQSNSEDIVLTIEEIAEIKKLIGKAYGPLIVGQTWEILERIGG